MLTDRRFDPPAAVGSDQRVVHVTDDRVDVVERFQPVGLRAEFRLPAAFVADVSAGAADYGRVSRLGEHRTGELVVDALTRAGQQIRFGAGLALVCHFSDGRGDAIAVVGGDERERFDLAEFGIVVAGHRVYSFVPGEHPLIEGEDEEYLLNDVDGVLEMPALDFWSRLGRRAIAAAVAGRRAVLAGRTVAAYRAVTAYRAVAARRAGVLVSTATSSLWRGRTLLSIGAVLWRHTIVHTGRGQEGFRRCSEDLVRVVLP